MNKLKLSSQLPVTDDLECNKSESDSSPFTFTAQTQRTCNRKSTPSRNTSRIVLFSNDAQPLYFNDAFRRYMGVIYIRD